MFIVTSPLAGTIRFESKQDAIDYQAYMRGEGYDMTIIEQKPVLSPSIGQETDSTL